MFGLLLLIYVRINNDNSLVNSIYDILKAEVATGIMDTVGNKVYNEAVVFLKKSVKFKKISN